MEDQNKIGDNFGKAPYDEAVKIATEETIKGVGSFLGKLCMPAAEEIGDLLRLKIRAYKLEQLAKIVEKSKGMLNHDGENLELSVHPRIVNEVIENGSWCDDDTLQNMWAGLLVSSANLNNANDSNVLYANILKNLTSIQARIIKYVCMNCKVQVMKDKFITGRTIQLTIEEIFTVAESDDLDQIDAELDSLRAQELIGSGSGGGGFTTSATPVTANIGPSPLLLSLFARTQGYKGEMMAFYKERITIEPGDEHTRGILIG